MYNLERGSRPISKTSKALDLQVAGAATPLVVGACVVGSGTVAYGASNLYEAGHNIYLGHKGDGITVATNPLRDTLFMGNDRLYHQIGGLFTTASAAMISIGQTKSIAKGLTEFTIGEVGGFIGGQTSYHGTKLLGGSEQDAQRATLVGNILGGLAASSAARRFSLNELPTSKSFIDGMSPEDSQRYIQWNKYAKAGLSPSDRVRVLEISEKAPKIKLKSRKNRQKFFKKIEAIDKEVTRRPDPSSYLAPEYIEAHRHLFDNGAARFQRFQPSESWNNGVVGGKDGMSFWVSNDHADIIEDIAKGDNRLYETLLGFDEGYLGNDPLYRLDLSPKMVSKKGVSIPSGNESGANEWWRPGGRTYPGNMPECVIKGISTKKGEHTWNVVN
ncbi:hypothetical protein [Streptococcus equi]|uniref:hypothetical protein n=1 Tax=Streptococcus equi TaxID=1336 RepID=UPI001D18E533